MSPQGLISGEGGRIAERLLEFKLDGLALFRKVCHRSFREQQTLSRLRGKPTCAFGGHLSGQCQASLQLDLFPPLHSIVVTLLKGLEIGLGIVQLGEGCLTRLTSMLGFSLVVLNTSLSCLKPQQGFGVFFLKQRQGMLCLLARYGYAEKHHARNDGHKNRSESGSRHNTCCHRTLSAPLAQPFPIAHFAGMDRLARQPTIQCVLVLTIQRFDLRRVSWRICRRKLKSETTGLTEDFGTFHT